MMQDFDIEQRLPIWRAFSELFLDTELRQEDYQHIAGVLSVSGRSATDLRAILETEVAPAFIYNLIVPAGTWDGWNDGQVRAIMLRSLRRKFPSPLNRLRRNAARRFVELHWAEIEPLLRVTDRTLHAPVASQCKPPFSAICPREPSVRIGERNRGITAAG